jgi:hypothetical protein
MPSYRTELACLLPPDEAVSAAAHGLVALGYFVSSTARARVHLRYEGNFEGHEADQPHMVTISATGRTLAFAFEAPSDGFFGDAPFSTFGRKELEARARRAASFTRPVYAEPSPAAHAPVVHHVVVERQVVVTRCKYCGHLTPVDLEACQGCGGAKFC